MASREPLGSIWRKLLARLAVLAGVVALVTVVAVQLAERSADEELDRELARATETYATSLEAWQQQYWALAAIYAEDPALRDANFLNGDALASIGSRLTRWNGATGSQATMIVRPDGTLLAGSFSSTVPEGETAMLGTDILRTAANGGLGRSFVTWSNGQRGYAFAFEVDTVPEAGAEIVVVIAPLSELEQYLQLQSDTVLVADRSGIVAVANRRDAIGRPIDEFAGPPQAGRKVPFAQRQSRLVNSRNGWTLSVSRSSEDAVQYVRLVGWLAATGTSALALLALLILSRRAAYVERLALQRKMRTELEETVDRRTAEMREANRHLREEIARRQKIEKDLRETHIELTQAAKFASVGQMSAVVSHELNQPLTAIRSNAELAHEYLDREDNDLARSKISTILDMPDRIARLTKRLLNFSRQPRTDSYPLALSVPLDDAFGIMEPRMQKEDAIFDLDVAPDLFVMGGRNRLSQVFINLIANALDACASADIPCHIAVRSRREDGMIELQFSDNGPGVSKEQEPRVFEAFFSTKERGKGLGLGLSVSAKIVSEFGGELLYRPGENGGATFIIAMPALAQKENVA
ncbi:sensor histidine kinase [Aurantiacibacter rhizosphaerae]|uniref:sensor histidine kinase n=1 Tax=Aurantiacibacter rhizosphaerae TaxID=2691582 RepID=UPI001365A9C2|nr:ATP-binding protein [Aurantiacibacter rhizosphaerae]